MRIKCETDKRVNIYSIWSGKQLILCKKMRRQTPIDGKNWIVLWPTKSGESQMINDETPQRLVDFSLSDKGLDYLRTIYDKHIKNNYIAQVEYYPINGVNSSLWKELADIHEFELWDILNGPVRIFRDSPRQNLIALYRVYEIDYVITENNIKRNGILPRYKELNEVTSQQIIEALKYAKPILSDHDFEERKNHILNIIQNYPPKQNKIKKFRTFTSSTAENSPHHRVDSNIYTENFEEKTQKNSLENKYCIFCGTKLPYHANYCSNCGKKQP